MAALSASVPNLVVPERDEIIRRARALWFVRCPPIYAVAIAVVVGDALGNFGFVVPFELAVCLSAVALGLFLIRAPGLAVAFALATIVRGMTEPVHRLMSPPIDAGSIRAFPEGAMLTVEGHLTREVERFPDKMRLYVSVDRASEESGITRSAHGVIRLTLLHPAGFGSGTR